MTTLNDYLYISKTIPETPDVNRLELTEPSTVKTTASEIKFFKDGADTENGETLGKITFYGKDSAKNETQFGEITGSINESNDTDEAGKLSFFVAESDGTNTALTAGLVLEGEHATDGEIDVTIGAGSASTTTVAGNLAVTGSSLTVNGVPFNDEATALAIALG